MPLVQPVFLGFVGSSGGAWADGMYAVMLRAGLLVIAVLSLDVYAALIRSEDRAVLDLHPVEPFEVVTVELLGVALSRWWLVPALSILLLPIGLSGRWDGWALAVGLLLGSFALGLCASAMVHLLAIEASESPKWEGVLEAIRGSNPREQAAFIYAPGAVLGGCALLVSQAAYAVPSIAAGNAVAGVWLVLPFIVAGMCWSAVPQVARNAWFQASGVLADIDARYAAMLDDEEGRRVYLDWMVRFLPADVAVWALKDLRHGWRHRRTWISGAWFCGVAAALAGWSGSETAPASAVAVGLGAVWLLAAVGVLLESDEPEFLRAWLPAGGAPKRMARLAVLLAWLQAVLWPPVLVLALRHGSSAALLALAVVGVAMVAAAVISMLAASLKERGLLLYGPVAALSAAAMAAQFAVVPT